MRARDEVAALESQGRFLDAVEALAALDPADRDAAMESQLLLLRHRSFEQLDRTQGREPWPPDVADPFPGQHGIPEVPWTDLDPDVMSGAIVHHGCLLVRGMVTEEQADHLRRSVLRAFEARRAAATGAAPEQTSPWFEPFAAGARKRRTGWPTATTAETNAKHLRSVDAPLVFNDLLATLEQRRVKELLTTHFGERPAVSVNKCELRVVEPAWVGPDFHQDGAFLGGSIRSVNVWLSLTDCGEDAAGLAVVPRRLHHIVETGADGAMFNWTVPPATLSRELGDIETVRPVFRPGDALLFDHFLLHRTDNDASFGHDRCAIETWFFAPSAYPRPKEGEKRSRRHLPLVF
jgi:hypothetical protein